MAKQNRYNPNPHLGFRTSSQIDTTARLRRQEGTLLLDAKGLKPSQSYLANKGKEQGRITRIPEGEVPRSEFIDSEKNQEKDFYSKPITDLLFECQKVIVLLNKGITGSQLDSIKLELKQAFSGYIEHIKGCEMKDCKCIFHKGLNLCYRCENPIKVKQGIMDSRNPIAGQTKETIKRNKSFRLTHNERHKTLDVTGREKGLFYQELDGKGLFNLKLREKQFSHRLNNTDKDSIYADIPCHFEIDKDENGKWFYFYQDGTGRDIRLVKVRKDLHLEKCSRCYKMKDFCNCKKKTQLQKVKKVYFENHLIDLATNEQVFPQKTYRITGQRCECFK